MKSWIIKLFLNAVAVVVAAYLLSGVKVENFGYAVLVAVLLAVLNVSVRPVLIFLTFPFTIVTLGLFILVINTAIIILADKIIGEGFQVESWFTAFLFSVILWAVNGLLDRIVKPEKLAAPSEPNTKIYDKDGNRIA